MPPRLFKIENYVSFNKDTNKSTCLICRKELCGLIIGNIKRHYEKMHNIKFTRDYHPKPTININTITRLNNEVLKLSKNEFLKCCIGLIAVKNLPLRIFDDERYFKKIIQPYQDEYRLDLNSENIQDALEFWSLRIRTYIKSKLYGKPLALKIDIVGRQGSNLMVIHIQQIEKYEIIIYTIGTIRIKDHNSPNKLKDAILKCLQEYEINIQQLYAISSDNHGRSLKALQLLSNEIEEINNLTLVESSGELSPAPPFLLSIVFNGSYIIELATRIYFKSIESDLNECRQTIKEIHLQQTNNIFLPCLDSGNRWKSTFDMVSSLRAFSTNSEINYEIHLEWLDAFLETYDPLRDWSDHQQCEQYIIGDFYRDWLLCEAKLKRLPGNEYAMYLLEAMLEVKQKILDNEAFNAALYFDPRFNHLDTPYFSEERRRQAVDHITNIENLIKSLEGDNKLLSDDYETQYRAKKNGRVDDPYNILEAAMPEISRSSTTNEINLTTRQKVENLSYTQRLPYSSNILEYWKYMQIKDPEIHALLKIVLATSINQTSLRRTCNALATTLNKEKSRISKTVMDNMLLVKLNPEILEKVEA